LKSYFKIRDFLSSDRLILALILLAIIPRFFAVFYLKNYNEPQTWEFGQIAENIVKSNGFTWDEYGRCNASDGIGQNDLYCNPEKVYSLGRIYRKIMIFRGVYNED